MGAQSICVRTRVSASGGSMTYLLVFLFMSSLSSEDKEW